MQILKQLALRLPGRPFVGGILCGILCVFAVRVLINETWIPDRAVAPLLVPDTSGSADAIVVMGAGVVGECSPNLNAVRRVLLGVQLWRERRAPLFVVTGGPGQAPCPVARAMSRLARDMGVPQTEMLIETRSRTTRENGEMTAQLLRRAGVRRVLVVTDRLHMRRATGVFAELGFEVERVSVPIYEGHPDNVSMLTAGVREMAALAYYQARGWVSATVMPRGDHAAARPAGTSGVGARIENLTGRAMQSAVTNSAGPVVVLGASYAGGWKLSSVNGVPVITKGVSGQQSFEMLERFERDVVAHRPRAVILWGFINDIFRADDMDRAVARMRASYIEMIARARKAGVEPIIATEVTIRPEDTWSETIGSWVGWVRGKESHQDRINRRVMEGNGWLIDLGKREGLLVLDLQSAVSEPRGPRRREFAAPDGSHITPAGYEALTQYATPILTRHFARGQSAPAG